MARYGRSNHWRWQPRDSHGRFGSTGGGRDEDPLNEWFLRIVWWKKLLFLLAVGVFVWWLVANGYVLVFIICGYALAWVMGAIAAWLRG